MREVWELIFSYRHGPLDEIYSKMLGWTAVLMVLIFLQTTFRGKICIFPKCRRVVHVECLAKSLHVLLWSWKSCTVLVDSWLGEHFKVKIWCRLGFSRWWRVVMKRGRPRKDEDLKEKMILSEFLRFTVFVAEGEAWGAYGHLVSQTRRVILYLICLKFICTNILILMIKQKSLCVVSTCRPPARYNSCAIDCRPCPGSKDQTLPSWMVNLKRGCQVFL